MRFLRLFFTAVAAAALAGAAVSYALDATVLNSTYVLDRIDSTTVYANIAESMPTLMASGLPVGQADLAKVGLGEAITPGYVKNLMHSLFTQIDQYLRGEGKPPSIDLSDLLARMRAAGYPVPPAIAAKYAVPITVQREQLGLLPGMYDSSARGKIWLPILAFLSLILIAVLSHHRHRFINLAKAFFLAALAMGVLYLLTRATPDLLTNLMGAAQGGEATKLAAPVVKQVGGAFSKDLEQWFGNIALIYTGAAVLLLLIQLVTKLVPHHAGKAHDTDGLSERLRQE